MTNKDEFNKEIDNTRMKDALKVEILEKLVMEEANGRTDVLLTHATHYDKTGWNIIYEVKHNKKLYEVTVNNTGISIKLRKEG